MALFKPEQKEFTSFTGLCECAVVGFENKSGQFDFADVLIEVELKQRDSDYTRKMSVMGTIEKDANGVVTGGNAITRIYALFSTLGCGAGINLNGEWEDENGDAISDIEDYLSSRFAQSKDTTNYDKTAYFYKEIPKAPGKPPYVKVMPLLQNNDAKGKAAVESSVKWRKDKGYLKEFTGSATPAEPVDLADLALDNL